ncbi:uncharacterized protein LOC117168447 [Belonocnema kinseyi]|uniref:uncharacterized protein LOC117168447 n=1 Tax=Belonocnema kinseyi TaxID=2817044 RepID=UPI00143CC2B8|nr:uncharacterized protein LOC117168447 [Belonocnema kinseyi]
MDRAILENKVNPIVPYTSWRRPPGPLNVWKVVDGYKNGEPTKFKIQEIPSDRFEEVLDHMCDYYLADEPQFECMKARDDPLLVYDQRLLWRLFLKQGISIGMFTDNSNGEKSIIVGVNILLVETKDDKAVFAKFRQNYLSPRGSQMDAVLWPLFQEANVKSKLKEHKYLTSAGLSVLPSFRGQSFGGKMLDVREDICRNYGINLSANCFSSDASIKLAERSGYGVLLERDYEKILNNQNQIAFPNCRSKTFKFMFKRFI